jgi:hypothetical protein
MSTVAFASNPALTDRLPADAIPPGVARLLAATGPARMMAARGMAPLRPADLAVAVYQLSHDLDDAVRVAANDAPVKLPDQVIVSMLREPLPAPVLHFLGCLLPMSRVEAIETLLYNPHTPDETFVVLGKRLPEREVEIICQNEARFLRSPEIVVAVFANKAARMSSVNRILELCARNNVVVDIPAYDEIVRAILSDPNAIDGTSDDLFRRAAEVATDEKLGAEALAAEAARVAKVAADSEEEEEEEPEEKKKSAIIDFGRLRIYEKVRLAMFGNAYARSNLMRDPNRMVAMTVIKSPMITDNEVAAAACNRTVHEDVIRHISNQREYMKNYVVRKGLVGNPKTPLPNALRMLPTLTKSDLKRLAKSKNIPSAISATAKRILTTRGS